MKLFSVGKWVFSVMGALFLVMAVVSYSTTSSFLSDAARANGTVVGFEESRGDTGTIYKPVVVFFTEANEPVKFVSRSGRGKPSVLKGDTVEVLYSPSEPNGARLDGFFELWGGTVIFASFGTPFFIIGAGLYLAGRSKRRKRAYLEKNGRSVVATFQSVDRNYSFSVNDKNPFVIVCQWLDPDTGLVHLFKSENLWFDPSPYLQRETLAVIIEPGNPLNYYMDISFLPRTAG
jgi:hypothetical protein